MEQARLTIASHTGASVARIDGELDKLAADTVGVRLTSLAQTGPLVVDLGGVTFLDSAGLHMLFALSRIAVDEAGGRVAIALESSPARRVVELVHLSAVIPVCSSVDEALATITVSQTHDDQ